ncbi:tripartite tricarboxylate transporter TctB family protein [Arthrobacter castelli]|uniref:tripartite tricarboxylate transporter TctB family protein n=1 Tax=Arthrobacter castelli TaxID=271431 RepID=UPI0005678A38|nr:tripartite tricarboxylate transporter TctB family protein [Arthrobacter castelli]
MTSKSEAPARTRPPTSDVVGTAILAAVGAFALVMGFGYGFLEEGGKVGPGFLPVVTGGFILVASLAEITRMYLTHGQRGGSLMDFTEDIEEEANAAIGQTADPETEGSSESTQQRDTFGRTASPRNRAIVKVFGILLAALLVMPWLGLLLSLTAMVLTVVLWVERKPLLPSVLMAAGALAGAYLIFVQALGVPLPQGALGLI